mmetsp:Transcript_3991/g.4531  ORF Transcript_3991/g.4531 Transcript_3991/m.4531 type:complete len:261 (+) Transcript_3991:658-1440(+)
MVRVSDASWPSTSSFLPRVCSLKLLMLCLSCLLRCLLLLLLLFQFIRDDGIRLDPLGECWEGGLLFELHWGVFACGEEQDGWEAFDLCQQLVFISSTIKLGHHYRVHRLEASGELLPGGSKSFAMSAPRGVDLKHDVLRGIHANFLEGFPHDNRDWLVILCWGLLGFEISCYRISCQTLAKCNEVILRVFSIKLELVLSLHLPSHHLCSCIGLKSEELSHLRGLFCVEVDSHVHHLALGFGCSRDQLLCVLLQPITISED